MNDQSNSSSWGKFSDSAEAELPEYRALSGLAVIGFLLGLASALAIVHVGLLFIGAAAVICSLVALARIAQLPSEISGRWLALAGIALALFWSAAGIARDLTQRRLLDLGSREFALQWFEYLKQGQPAKALEMGRPAGNRRPLGPELMDAFLSDEVEYESLQQFVGKPEVHALLALGDQAQVRHFACVDSSADFVSQVYAVTYDDHGHKKSFLVKMNLKRHEYPRHGVSAWQAASTDAPWTPQADEQKPAG